MAEWFGSKVYHKAKHAAEHAEHEVEHAGKEAVDDVEHELEKAVMASLDDLKHLADGLKNDLEKAAYEGKHEIEKATADGKDDLQKKLHSTEYWLDKHKDDGVKAIDYAKVGFETAYKNDMELLDKAVDAAKADIERIAKSEAAELTEEALEKGLKEAHDIAVAIEQAIGRLEDKAPTIVDMLNNQSLPINLGPLVLTYANGVSRIHDIADALEKVTGEDFRLTQAFINDLLNGLGPDTISIHADVEFFVEVGLDLDDIPFAAFVEIADIVFDAVGIPKGE